MKTNTLVQVSGMILLAAAVSFVMLVLVYALQNSHLMPTIASIGWNGTISL